MNGQRLMFRLTTAAKLTCQFRRQRGVQEQNVQFCLIYRDPHDRLIKVGIRGCGKSVPPSVCSTYQPNQPKRINSENFPLPLISNSVTQNNPHFFKFSFLVATKQLYEKVSPPVRWAVGLLVVLLFGLLRAT